jgi:hypothetical protein
MSLREHPEKEMEIAEVIRSGEEIEVEVLADACRGGMRFSLIEDAVLQRLERELEREVEAGRMCRLLSILVHRCVAKISDDVGNAARVESALARAAEHGDARVRSNALEAIGKWERAHPGRLAVLCRDAVRDEEGRPRATALRELARFAGNQQAAADVAENVMTMLGDAAAGHRLSATWASERVLVTLGPDLAGERWGELCDRVVEVADRDADLAVRARANAAARRLMAEIRVRSRRGDGVARVVGVGG